MTWCMGNPKNRYLCDHCKRLPRSSIDEEAKDWFKWKEMPNPCDRGIFPVHLPRRNLLVRGKI